MPNYNSSIIAGLSGGAFAPQRRPQQVRGVSPLSGMPTQGTLNPNPALDVYDFNDQMSDELRERSFNNARVANLAGPQWENDPNVAIAKASQAPLEGLMKSYQAENANSDISKQRADVEAWDKFDREATSLGYEGMGLGERTLSPGQARNIHARQQAEFEKTIPLLQEQARGDWERDKAQQAYRQGIDVERLKGQIETDKVDQYVQLANTLGAGGANGQGGRQISSMSLPGGFRVGFDNDELGEGGIPTRLLTELAFQRYSANAAKTDREKQAAQGSYIQSQLNALNSARNIDPTIKAWVGDLIVDPNVRDMDFEDILQQYNTQAQLEGRLDEIPTDEEAEAARVLFRTLRGR